MLLAVVYCLKYSNSNTSKLVKLFKKTNNNCESAKCHRENTYIFKLDWASALQAAHPYLFPATEPASFGAMTIKPLNMFVALLNYNYTYVKVCIYGNGLEFYHTS